MTGWPDDRGFAALSGQRWMRLGGLGIVAPTVTDLAVTLFAATTDHARRSEADPDPSDAVQGVLARAPS